MINWVQGIVYKLSCHDCTFAYINESKGKHDPGSVSNKESAIKQHAESTDHNNHHEMPKSSNMVSTTV